MSVQFGPDGQTMLERLSLKTTQEDARDETYKVTANYIEGTIIVF